ncbi:YD repeat-containing protein [Pseudoxanthomonas sp. SORGH_AS 997]|uniref:YD repeat-containing protein n=2 Tax=Pseudoxanthomonas TaxID=83618 RepID=A0AAW8G7W1_9GAMM|nr:YD repeat-containing protein [Pseudoxanthomonas winnipegensis]MDQ1135031.1 YD repeat-containing protein [Pseudoxanthomonas winnipegensis]MDR6138736.1 YD repeat-containing protein [Pseudoxanthomonas sp. SORGH_AS_0997]
MKKMLFALFAKGARDALASVLSRKYAAICALGLTAAIVNCTASAQDVDEYNAKVKNFRDVKPLGQNVFGERVELYKGGLSFFQKDLAMPGRGPDISIGRLYTPSESHNGYGVPGFQDWQLSVPHLIAKSTSKAWNVLGSAGSNNPLARCSQFSSGAPYHIDVDLWFNGYQLVTGEGSQEELLLRASQNANAPGGQTAQYPVVTASGWQFACLTQTANGQPGEAFLATAPNGDKYWFDWLILSRTYKKTFERTAAPQPLSDNIYDAMLMVTKVEDRFGNYVTYQYDGDELKSIQGSDGRLVTISWTSDGSAITNVSSSGRTWTYAYGSGTTGNGNAYTFLQSVTTPESRQWTFALDAFYKSRISTGNAGCSIPTRPALNSIVGTMTAPSGVQGTFTIANVLHGRSNVPFACLSAGGSSQFARAPAHFDALAIIGWTYSGPGINRSWSYAYGPMNASWDTTCASGCEKTTTVDETAPDGVVTRYTYSNEWGEREGKQISVDVNLNATAGRRTTSYTYAPSAGMPYPTSIGETSTYNSGSRNDLPLTTYTPPQVTTVAQDGDTFTTTVNSFDAFAKPLSVTRSNSLGASTTDAYEYENNTTKWVLAQVRKVTNAGTGLVSSELTYNSDALPVARYAFGRLLHSYAYNTDGTLASFSDGAGHATQTSDWYRGIPRTMTFADNTTQHAEVSDWGWITSITDALGNKTCYAYDAMGRVSQVTYPSESTTGVCDASAWTPTTLVFEPVGGSEYGLPAGHWRQTVSTGAGSRITYFDAMWQPLLVREFDGGDVAGTQRFTRFTYDANGRQTFASYPSTSSSPTTGNWTGYDALGRTTSSSVDSDSGTLTTLTSYLSGHRTQLTDPRNLQTTTSYQVYDEPAYDSPTLILAPEDSRTVINRDVFGKPLSITRSNGSGSVSVTRSYVYQADQQLCKSIEPEAGATVYGYDAAGNIVKSATGLNVSSYVSTSSCDQDQAWASGRMVSRTYDARDRLATLSFPDGRGNQNWSYTADGLPSQVTTYNSNNGDVVSNTYIYNHRRLLVGEDMAQPGADTVSMDYGYDANGNLAMHVYPSTLAVSYAPNALGQPTRAGSYATGVSYYPNGAIKQFTYGNGIVHTMTQNARQLPARSTDGAVMDMGYSFDADGNVASTTDYVDGRQTRSMTYDGLNRLATTSSVMFGGNNQAAFTYDALDNLQTFKVGDKVDYQYNYDSQQRLILASNAIGPSVGVGYDAQGNVENRNGKHFDFDYGNRLRCNATAAGCAGSVIERYRYDANGRRVLNDSPTLGKIFSLYGQDGVLRRQQDQRTGKTSEYVYLGGSLVARVVNVQALPVPTTSVPASSSSGLYTVSWTATANTTSYEVQEKVGSTGAWTGVYSGTGNSLAFSGKGNGAYSYRARSCLYANCGAWSNEATVAVELVPTSAPSITSPATAVNGNFSVSWGAVGNTTAYKLEQQVGSGSWSEIYSGLAQSKDFTGLAAGTYGYRVRACSGSGCGGYSTTTQTTAVYAPGTPGTPSAPGSVATGSYTVSWSDVGGASQYRLEESANGGAWSEVLVSAATSYGASGKGTGSYGYRLRACNAAGCSGYSGTASVTVTLAPTDAPGMSVPAASTTGSYAISWSAVAGASSYQVQENGGLIYNGSGTSTSIGGKGNGSYQYNARACNAGGCGPWSSTATTTVSIPPPIPSAPTGLTVRGQAVSPPGTRPVLSEWDISWSAVAGATSYQVGYNTTSGPSVFYTGSATKTDYTHTGSYKFSVRACNDSGCSAWTVQN